MVDYGYYTGTYVGSLIPEGCFDAFICRATAELERLRRMYRVTAYGSDSERMALCGMAETLYALEKRRGIRSTSVGGVSVTYEDTRAERKAMYRAASVYLDFYRGVGV